MNVVRAEGLGFCFGVRRAIEMTSAAAREDGPLFTLGAIVHNAGVAESLAQRGARPAASLDEVPDGATVAVTAHGVGPDVLDAIRRRRLRLIDATCPIVRRAQELASSLTEEGFRVVLYGDEGHPEVRGILGWTRGQGRASLAPTIDLEAREKGLALLAQTTARRSHFAAFTREIAGRYHSGIPEIRVVDTICPETARRYEGARDLAQGVQVMVVVGSPTSANTRRLIEASRETGVPTYGVERATDLDSTAFVGVERCGVTAGTSTPESEIDEVVLRLSSFGVP